MLLCTHAMLARKLILNVVTSKVRLNYESHSRENAHALLILGPGCMCSPSSPPNVPQFLLIVEKWSMTYRAPRR
jgi:hypothetical protein